MDSVAQKVCKKCGKAWPRKGLVSAVCRNPACENAVGVLESEAGIREKWERYRVKKGDPMPYQLVPTDPDAGDGAPKPGDAAQGQAATAEGGGV